MTTHEKEHIGIPGYVGVFLILVVGTILTYVVALVDLDSMLFHGANTLVALLIAFIKMTFVILFFMHVYWGSRLIWLAIVSAIFWLFIIFAYTMQDYLTRAVR
ncbi:MAG: cytochrome C oxidase subunit IV family protein [Pyrinomonadaceae bacterium]